MIMYFKKTTVICTYRSFYLKKEIVLKTVKEKFSYPYETITVLSTCFLTAWCVQKRGRRVDDVGCDAQPSRRNKVNIFT
jgi:hypothetical protein